MTMRLLTVLLISCFGAFAAHAAALDLDGPGWPIVDATDCPESPETVVVNAVPAWRLEIGETCAPRAVLRDADDGLRSALKGGDVTLVVKLHVANGYLRSGDGDAYATVMLEGPDARQFASRNRLKLVNGSHSVAIPLDRTMWTDGKAAPDSEWNALLANLGKVGIALGGESGEDQDIAGSAGLFMIEFKVD